MRFTQYKLCKTRTVHGKSEICFTSKHAFCLCHIYTEHTGCRIHDVVISNLMWEKVNK